MSYPTITRYTVQRAAYAPATFGARGPWVVLAEGDGWSEAEDAAVRRGRSFATRREAQEWVRANPVTTPATGA